MDLQAVLDRIEINELLSRCARGVDTHDGELWTSVFTPDSVLDHSDVGFEPGSPEEIAAVFVLAFATIPMAQRHITNVEIDVDGDRASVRAMFANPMRLPGMDELSFCAGTYHHDVVRTPDGWRSERLVEKRNGFVNRPGAR